MKMGKRAEAGTPKYLANKMKSKGLQKLRWFCQMCQKQCRDDNGFKCHITSESHQRQLLLFADNPHKYLDEFSKEFADSFMHLLRRRFGTKRIQANQVYQEYIGDKSHLHMNATRWLSLTGFVKWLGKTDKCKIEETEKGWFITYIDKDPETLERQRQLAKKEKMDKDDEERMQEFLEKQVERGKEGGEKKEETFTELTRETEEDKIKLDINLGEVKLKAKQNIPVTPSPLSLPPVKKERDWSSSASVRSTSSTSSEKRKLSALEEIRIEQEKYKEKKFKKDYWLLEGIVVKIVTKRLGDKYYKQKGFVVEIIDNYVAIVKMIESGHKLKLDQEHLETVIPSIGKPIKVLNGEYRGSEAILLSIDVDKFSANIELTSGSFKNKILKNISYEYISKINAD